MKKILEQSACLKEEEIKRYLKDGSTKEERHRVENHLLDCLFCTDAVGGFQAHYNFEEHDELEKLKDDIEKKTNTASTAPNVIPLNTRSRFTLNQIAAAILLLIIPAAGWLYWNSNSEGDLFDGSDSFGTLRSGVEEEITDVSLLKALELFNAQQFEAALGLTEAILDTLPENITATYYAGQSALKANQYELAEHYFMTLRLNSDYYFEDASWLMVQACLGANKKEKAIQLLDEIMHNPSGFYYDKAKRLKESLK